MKVWVIKSIKTDKYVPKIYKCRSQAQYIIKTALGSDYITEQINTQIKFAW